MMVSGLLLLGLMMMGLMVLSLMWLGLILLGVMLGLIWSAGAGAPKNLRNKFPAKKISGMMSIPESPVRCSNTGHEPGF